MEVYCFKRNQSLDQIKNYLGTVTAPRDKIYKRESTHCLEIEISAHRKELLEKWMYKRYRPIQSYNEDSGLKQQNAGIQSSGSCRLKIETESSGNSNTKTFSVGQKNKLNSTVTRSSGKKVSNLLLGVGFSGFITVNNERVELICQRAGSTGYRVSVSLQGENNGIGTSLEVRKGQRVNMGEVVNDLKRKSKSVGVPKGVEVEETKGEETIRYFLIAE